MSADAPERNAGPAAKAGASIALGFPRSGRLLRHSDFDRVYKQGRRQFSSHMTVFYLRQAEGGARIGFTVGKVLGGAVVRNRIKRRLREAVRQRRSALAGIGAVDVLGVDVVGVDIVINPKKSILTLDFSLVLEEVGRALETVAKKIAQK